MADTKASAFPAVTTLAGADSIPVIQGGVTSKATGTQVRGYLTAASTAPVAGGYAADTYLAGSAITIPTAGGWKVSSTYVCEFDITKTAAGTASIVITVRLGTLGTTADTALNSFTLGAGTAAADSGVVRISAAFRSIGAGTSAVLVALCYVTHNLSTTGLTNTGSINLQSVTSAGFASTTQTIIGVSFNGGAAFSGTNTLVDAQLYGI